CIVKYQKENKFMIKRTSEKIMTWIGIGFQFFVVLGITLILVLMNMESVQESMIKDGTMTASEAASSAQVNNIFLIIGLVLNIILLVLAILSVMWIYKKTKVAGIILIIIGVISLFGNWIGAILWTISGIILLVKKPKVPQTNLYNEKEVQDDNPFSDNSNSMDKQNAADISDNKNSNHISKEEDPYKY